MIRPKNTIIKLNLPLLLSIQGDNSNNRKDSNPQIKEAVHTSR